MIVAISRSLIYMDKTFKNILIQAKNLKISIKFIMKY